MKTFLVDRSVLTVSVPQDDNEETPTTAKRRVSEDTRDHDHRRRATDTSKPTATTTSVNGAKKQKKREGGKAGANGVHKQASLKSFFVTRTDEKKSTDRDYTAHEEKQQEEGCTATAAAVSGVDLDFAAQNVSERASASSAALHANLELQLQQNVARQQELSAAKLQWQALQHKMANSIPRCKKHGEVCKIRVVKRKDSPHCGRSFYCCPRPAGAKDDPETDCGFFKWASSSSRSQKATITTMFT